MYISLSFTHINSCGDPRMTTQPPATSALLSLLNALHRLLLQQLVSLLAGGWIRLRMTLELWSHHFAA